jgi:hypothetical protein
MYYYMYLFLWKNKIIVHLVQYGTMSCSSGELGGIENANRPNSIEKINTTPKCGFLDDDVSRF